MVERYIKKVVLKNIINIIVYINISNFENFVVYIKNYSFFKYKMLLDIFVVDYPKNKKRFEVNYMFLSLDQNSRLLVKIFVNEEENVKSLYLYYKSALWLERECWDLYGVCFLNHPDLRRLLTDYGFLGHPLRKDFPLTGFLEIRYDDRCKTIITEPLELAQEMRLFDFVNPWYKERFK